MNINFRPLSEEDLNFVKEIYDYYIFHSTATFHTHAISITGLKEFIFINHPVYQSFVIQLNGKDCGYCYITQYKKRQAYDRTAEVTIYLKPTSTNIGIGYEALKFLETVAKSKGISNLIGIITGENTQSIRLFEKAGYFKCAHFKNVGEKFGKILDVVGYQKEI